MHFETAIGRICAFVALMTLSVPGAFAQTTPSISANELVRRAVQTQLKDPGGNIHFMYRLHRQTPDRNEVREVVETSDGTLARVIMTNGKPLSADQQQAEDQRLQRYINDPTAWQQRRKKQKEDSDRSDRLLAALPNAFLYSYDGHDTGADGEPLVRLSFKPNPSFDPPNRDLRVFQGMQGKMWVNTAANRLVRLDAKLFRDVDFGWGILGRLYQGGSFEIEQRDIGDGRWEVVKTVLNFDGKELMFKGIHIKETETLSDFHRVPQQLSLAQGIEMLHDYNPEHDTVAQREPARTSPGGGTPPK
jgi:hypothetical protein